MGVSVIRDNYSQLLIQSGTIWILLVICKKMKQIMTLAKPYEYTHSPYSKCQELWERKTNGSPWKWNRCWLRNLCRDIVTLDLYTFTPSQSLGTNPFPHVFMLLPRKEWESTKELNTKIAWWLPGMDTVVYRVARLNLMFGKGKTWLVGIVGNWFTD